MFQVIDVETTVFIENGNDVKPGFVIFKPLLVVINPGTPDQAFHLPLIHELFGKTELIRTAGLDLDEADGFAITITGDQVELHPDYPEILLQDTIPFIYQIFPGRLFSPAAQTR